MKDTLIEIKNNLQGNNSKVDEAENEISNLEQEEAKNNQSVQQEETRIQKNENNAGSLWDKTSGVPTFASWVFGSKRERTRNLKPIWKNNDRKLP